MLFKSDQQEPSISIEPQTTFEHVFSKNSKVSENIPLYVDAEDPDQFITYGQVKTQVLKFAAGLKRAFGVTKGVTVSMISYNTWEYPIAMYGTTVAGGTFAAIDFSRHDPACLARDLALVDTKVLIVHPRNLAEALRAAQIIGFPKSSILTLGQPVGSIRSVKDVLLNHSELATPTKLTRHEFETHPAFLYFTSGTTGQAKAVIITHKMMVLGTMFVQHPVLHHPALSTLLKNTHAAFLSCGSMYHASGLLLPMHLCPKLGIRVYLMQNYDIDGLCRNIQKYRITDLVLAPYATAELARSPVVGKYDLSSLLVVISTGSCLDPSVVKAIAQRLRVPVFNAYGMTEMWGVCHPDPLAAAETLGLPGKLSSGVEAKIVDENGKELGVGKPGELLLRGPGLTPGYYNDPEGTKQMFDADGFYRTGDLCVFDHDGVLTVIDRLKDMIKYRGHTVTPKELEAALMSSPHVLEAAAVGIYRWHDAKELPTAYVVLVDGHPHPDDIEKQLLDHAHSHLPEWIRLDGGIKIVKELPRTAGGKVQKRVLREIASRELNHMLPSPNSSQGSMKRPAAVAAAHNPQSIADKLSVT